MCPPEQVCHRQQRQCLGELFYLLGCCSASFILRSVLNDLVVGPQVTSKKRLSEYTDDCGSFQGVYVWWISVK